MSPNESLQRANGSPVNGKAAVRRDDEATEAAGESPPPLLAGSSSPITSPPYWLARHARTASSISQESVLPHGAITLQDNEDNHQAGDATSFGRENDLGSSAEYGRDRNSACWAKSVEIIDHVTVNGSATNIGAFVVWVIRVETLTVRQMLRLHHQAFPMPFLTRPCLRDHI
jgi:hypothetical protein